MNSHLCVYIFVHDVSDLKFLFKLLFSHSMKSKTEKNFKQLH